MAPALVTVTDLSTAWDGVVSWSWDFDDNGATSGLQNPTHTFNDPGTYNVSLEVTDGDGSMAQIVVPVEVIDPNAPPIPSLSPWGVALLVASMLGLGWAIGAPARRESSASGAPWKR